MKTGRRSPLYIALSICLTAGVFFFLSRFTSIERVVSILRGVDKRGVAMFFVLSMAMSFFRTWRYGLVLNISGHSPPQGPLFLIVLVRNFLSDILPARLGTLSFVYLATSRLGIPLSSSVSSFALSFLFDIAALVPMVAAAALLVGLSHLDTALPLLLASALFLAVVTGGIIFSLPLIFGLSGRIAGSLPVLKNKWKNKWRDFCAEVEGELRHAREEGVFLRLFSLSLLVRLSKYGSLYVLLHAFLRPLEYGARELSPAKIFLGLVSSELAASLPVSGIAGFGVYEGTWSLVFTLLGMPAELAATTGVSHHVFTQVYGYLLGAFSLLVLLVLPIRSGPPALSLKAKTPALSFYLRMFAVLAAGIALLLAGFR
jgi:uncharacterized protein (TIRG00374 family)